MDNRISSTSPRPVATNNVAAPANNTALSAANNASLNTADAVALSNGASASSLQDIASAVQELESRIAELEAQVANIGSTVSPVYNRPAANEPSANGPVLPPGMTLPPFPGAQSTPLPANNAPAANLPATNLPAINAPVNNLPATNLPSNNVALGDLPANNLPVNNLPPANVPANNVPANNVPANNTTVAANDTAAPTSTVQSDLRKMLDNLKALQAKIVARIGQLEKLIRGETSVEEAKAQRDELAKQAAGLEAVSHVLRQAKLTGLTPEEEQAVLPALQRVHAIGKAIGEGDSPNQYAAELFALKHTLIDPAGAGQHKAVTHGAQVVGMVNDFKTGLQEQLADEKLDAKSRQAIEAQLKGLIDIEKALDGAKLTRLNKKGEARAIEAIGRLAEITETVGSGTQAASATSDEVFRLGQTLKNPNATPSETKPAAVEAGAAVLKQINDAKAAIHERLRDIDDKVMAGEAPEKYAGERARLMEQAEGLNELASVIGGVRLDQSSPAAKKTVEEGLKTASQLAAALAKGDSPNQYRAEIFVLKQTFQEPIPSRDNAAVQSGAGALQLIGKAEARILKRQEAIASEINRGADARKFDAELAQLHRHHEDLELIRHTIEGADLGGLTPEQEAQGAKVIDQIRDIAMKVANGEDFTKHAKAFKGLAKELADLRHWQPAGAAKPTPKPEPTKPVPAPTKPEPTKPTPAPAEKPLEPGAMYKVQAGDYLTKIAREKLGDPTRFKQIIELNKDKYPSLEKNPDLIYPGWMLVLPKK